MLIGLSNEYLIYLRFKDFFGVGILLISMQLSLHGHILRGQQQKRGHLKREKRQKQPG
jgi:hypothetical protein